MENMATSLGYQICLLCITSISEFRWTPQDLLKCWSGWFKVCLDLHINRRVGTTSSFHSYVPVFHLVQTSWDLTVTALLYTKPMQVLAVVRLFGSGEPCIWPISEVQFSLSSSTSRPIWVYLTWSWSYTSGSWFLGVEWLKVSELLKKFWHFWVHGLVVWGLKQISKASFTVIVWIPIMIYLF